jgi:hypothetical protein
MLLSGISAGMIWRHTTCLLWLITCYSRVRGGACLAPWFFCAWRAPRGVSCWDVGWRASVQLGCRLKEQRLLLQLRHSSCARCSGVFATPQPWLLGTCTMQHYRKGRGCLGTDCSCCRRMPPFFPSAGCARLAFVGHSQGTTQAFGALAANPGLRDRLSLAIMLAPAVHMRFIQSPALRVLAAMDADTVRGDQPCRSLM